MPITRGLSPEGSSSTSPVPKEQGMYGVPGASSAFNQPRRRSPVSETSREASYGIHRTQSTVNMAQNNIEEQTSPSPKPLTTPQPNVNEGVASDRESLKQVETYDDTIAGLLRIGQDSVTDEQNKPTYTFTDESTQEVILKGSFYETRAGWKQWLVRDLEDFAGNVDNAAVLLADLTETKKHIYKKYADRGLRIEKPLTFILLKESLTKSVMSEALNGRAFLLKKSMLASLSKLNMQESMTMKTTKGEVQFRGKPSDWLRLATVEEIHHGIRRQIKK